MDAIRRNASVNETDQGKFDRSKLIKI